MPIEDWSTVPAENNAAPPVGAPEGMAAADVNNTMRQMMADIKLGSGFSVNTITELKALDTSRIGVNNVVNVLGHTTIGDGGAGDFYWNSTSTATDDGGRVIQATGVITGRWIRIYEGVMTTKMFGFVADGSTSDVARLDLALASVDALIFSPGTYPPYVFSQANKTLIFDGGATFKLPNNTVSDTDTSPAITVHVTGDNVEFMGNFTVDGNVQNNGFAAINPSLAQGAIHIEAENVRINDTVRIINANWMSFTAGYETIAATNLYVGHIDVFNSQHYATSFWNVDGGYVGSITAKSGADTGDDRVRLGSQNASSVSCEHLTIGGAVVEGAFVVEARTFNCVLGTIDTKSACKFEDCRDVSGGDIRVTGGTGGGFGFAMLSCERVQTGNVAVVGHNAAPDVVIRYSEVVNCQTENISVIGTVNNAMDLNIRSADGLTIGDVILRDPVGTGRGFLFDFDVAFAPQRKIRIGNMITTGHTADDFELQSFPNVDIEGVVG